MIIIMKIDLFQVQLYHTTKMQWEFRRSIWKRKFHIFEFFENLLNSLKILQSKHIPSIFKGTFALYK